MKTFLVLLALFSCVLGRAAENPLELFRDANQNFDKGEYDAASAKYGSLIQAGIPSGDLYFNRANADFKAGKLGPSLFNYRRALELLPRDADVKFNLAYAREKVTDRVESKESFLQRLVNLSQSINEKEAYYLTAISLLLFLLCCIVSTYRKLEWTLFLRNSLVGVVSLFAMIALHHSLLESPYGVVKAAEVKIYSGLGKDNVVLFSLHEGVECIVAESEGDWIRIQLADGKQGWTKAENILYVRAGE